MQPLDMLLIGDFACPEFETARRQMEAAADVVSVDAMDAALAYLRDASRPPELIVVAQAQPSECSHRLWNALHAAAPLSRVVALLGSWCEGESRTGDPWPAALRVYWYRWPAFFADALSRIRAGEPPTWSLPLTAGEDERALLAATEAVTPATGLIAIAADDTQTASWLADACRARGYATVWLMPRHTPAVSGVAAVVCDLPHVHHGDLERLQALAAQFRPAPVVALLNNPRIEERRLSLAAGAAEVVAKPLELAELYWALDHVMGESAESYASAATVTWQRRISRRQFAS